jgi:hypothetical protein
MATSIRTFGANGDADGRRVGQTVDGVEAHYLWDEASLFGDVILETDASGAIQASWLLGGGELLSQTRGGDTSYYLADALGSARALAVLGGDKGSGIAGDMTLASRESGVELALGGQ